MLKRNNVLSAGIVFFNLLITLNTQAQYQVPGSEDLLNKMRMKVGGNVLNNVKYDEIKGSPYIFPAFKQATIITQKGENVKLPVRYDLYANEMEVKNESGIYSIAQPEIIKLIITDSIKLIYSSYKNASGQDESRKHSYFILRSDGKCMFLIKKELRLQDSEKPKLYQDAKPAEFIFLKDSYFFKIGDNDAVRINNKNDALEIMADKESQIGAFIKENRINPGKAEDLEKLTEYYNSLNL